MIRYSEYLRQRKISAKPSAVPATSTGKTIGTRLAQLISEVLALPQEQLDPDCSFADLGLSSLLAVRLIDRINRMFELRLGIEVLFNHTSPRRLAAHIAERLPGPSTQAKQTTTAQAIAVIGYSGRFAGAASPLALWQALLERRSLISALPDYRRQDKDVDPPRAGFLFDAERFDASFFGLSNREAAAMDPVQRLFLEQAWCALEHAGLTRTTLADHKVGVYAGASNSGHERLVPVTGKAVDAYVMTGSLAAMTAARIAYFLDLEGPALTVDTACSSSLMAVHLACQALVQGEAEIAIAGGANLFVDERPFAAMQRAGMLSPSNACRPFDDTADGIAVAEAAACVVLKPLALALAEGDRVDAVIRASAANQDGRSNGITAPSADAQARLLNTVLEKAGVAAETVDLVETHGTGTRLGDPIEAAALRTVYAERPADRPLRLAAIKGCIGHASEAAGISGLIASILALQNCRFPPVVGFSQLNSHVAESLSLATEPPLRVLTTAEPWPEPSDHPRRAGVSAFGLSGTNVHLLLEQAPQQVTEKPIETPSQTLPFLLSAATEEALARRRDELVNWLSQPNIDLLALAHTLMFHREPMACRWSTLASNPEELVQRLSHNEPTGNQTDQYLIQWNHGESPEPHWLTDCERPPLALPVYPFHGPRLWGGRTLAEADSALAVHPLLGEQQDKGVYLRRFHADETLVADHRVAGRALLHAALLMEMALAAACRIEADVALTDLAWLKPITIHSAQESVRVKTTATPGTENQIDIAITVDGVEHVRCHAEPKTLEPQAAALDPAALWQTLPNRQLFNHNNADVDGVFLGPSFPGPDRIRADQQQALAVLEHAPKAAGFELSSALLDAAIRTAAGLLAQAEENTPRLRFPARLEALHVLQPVPESNLWLHAKRRTQGTARTIEQIDIQILSDTGATVLVLTGLTLAAAVTEQAPASNDQPSAMAWHLVWQPLAAPPNGYDERIADLVIADSDSNELAQLICARQAEAQTRASPLHTFAELANDGKIITTLPARAHIWFLDTAPINHDTRSADTTLSLLHLLKALADNGRAQDPLLLRIVTIGALAALPDEQADHALAAATLGLGKAAGCEFPTWQLRLIDLPTAVAINNALLEKLLTDPGCPLGEPVALRGEQRLLPRLASCRNDHSSLANIDIDTADHIIIVGGMGRLGRALARNLATSHQTRLSLIGRSPLDQDRAAFLAAITELGGSARYYRADVSDCNALQIALDAALAEQGPAALLIQAVVDPVFARIERSITAEFAAALAPKVNGLINLGELLAEREIGALSVFSSIGAFSGFPANDGQASYCAACCFEASYAHTLARSWQRPVKVIHWGLWDSGDYTPELLSRMRASGLYAMDLAQIGPVLKTLLPGPEQHLVYARLTNTAWLDLGTPPEALADLGTPAVTAAYQALSSTATASRPISNTAETIMSARISAGLAKALLNRGFQSDSRMSTVEALSTLAELPRHRPLAQALLRMAERRGLLQRDGEQLCFTDAIASIHQPACHDEPGIHAALELLAHCLEALPSVLAGLVPATEVLFPQGSMSRVEQVYREHPVLADRSSRVAAAVAAATAVIAAQGAKARILEIGAGTGATTAVVLETLAAQGLSQSYDYLYSDISPAFVNHGHKLFGDRIHTAAVLDISRPPSQQKFTTGAWDMVLASNVLHATPDIHATLSHVAQLLAPQGILLVNEMVESDDFATLTFGLLDGWWTTEDPECRLTDGPILSLQGWQARLRSAGLQARLAYPSNAAKSRQAVILAVAPATADTPATPTPRQPIPPATQTVSPCSGDSNAGTTQTAVETVLRKQLATILDLDADSIEREQPLMDLGVDSLIAPQIAEDVAAELGCPLRTTDIYKYGNLAALATHLRQTYGAQLTLAEVEPQTTTLAPPQTAPQASDSSALAPSSDVIAIIGLSVRLAGAPDLDALWTLLNEGRSATQAIDRFDIEPWFDPAGGAGRTYARWGGFLEDYDRFDPYFFNITPAEAEVMDPQQRILMEEAWKALEHAGLAPDALSGSRCGVFVGASANNYTTPGTAGLRTLGGSMAILSARIAYFLNLRGPTFPIDTGCSSSLVALHLACQSLRGGECNIALAGGVSVNLIAPEIFIYLSDAGMASRNGVCRAFDDAADGFVPGEGAGVAVLKRLDDALADGDRIDAVILGSGINQDGRSAGLTAPSADAQTALELEVYRRFQLDPSHFGMVEAHGTGTRLGDPIEVKALSEAFRHYTDRRTDCALGSIKTNIGHTMAAAGIAGLAKTVLALQHRRIPASLHFSTPNQHVAFEKTPFFVPTKTTPWPKDRALQTAISSFGFSGTNAHIVVAAAPTTATTEMGDTGPWLFTFSARDGDALRKRLSDFIAWLEHSDETLDLSRVAATLARGRAHWRYRCAFVASSKAALLTTLAQAASGPLAQPVGADYVPSLVRPAMPVTPAELEQLAEAYRTGDKLDWDALFGPRRPPLALPAYPFARERFWLMPDLTAPATQSASATAEQHQVAVDHPLLRAHSVGGRRILPGTLVLELMRESASAISDVYWLQPLAENSVPTTLKVSHDTAGAVEVITDKGTVLARGRRLERLDSLPAKPPLKKGNGLRVSGAELYARFAAAGFDYGNALQVIDWVEIGEGVASAQLTPAPSLASCDPLLVNAALLDGALQTAAAIGFGDQTAMPSGEQWVPQRLTALQVWRQPSASCQVNASLEPTNDPDSLSFTVQILDKDGARVAAFAGMTARRLPTANFTPSAEVYIPTWQIAAPEAPAPPSSIVIAASHHNDLEAKLRQHFQHAHLSQLDPADDLEQLASQLAALPGPLVIVHPICLPNAAPEDDPITVASGLAAMDPIPVLAETLGLVQALIRAGRPDGARLVSIAGGRSHDPAMLCTHTIAGLYRTLQLEAPLLSAQVLLYEQSQERADVLIRELSTMPGPDSLIRYTDDGHREVTVWQAQHHSATTPTNPSGVSVITGGLGGLGLALARHLAKPGSAKLALISRSEPDAATYTAVQDLEAAGATVLTLRADVADLVSLRTALASVRSALGPISAVYHLAGQLRDGFLLHKSHHDLNEVVAVKAHGAILLDLLTRQDPLEAFVLFGSTAAVFGVTGQAVYAAANAFMDAFAERREQQRGAGLRAGRTLCLAWPLWADGHMQPTPDGLAKLSEYGLVPMPSATGFKVLAECLTSATARALILHGRSGLLTRLQRPAQKENRITPTSSTSSSDLATAESGFDYLCQILSEITKLPRQRIEPDMPFDALGIDSLIVMKLNDRLEADLGDIAKTLFFEFRTAGALADHLSRIKGTELQALQSPGKFSSNLPSATAPPPSLTVPTIAFSKRETEEGKARRSTDEAIAIIGVSGLYPQAPDLDTFWSNLRDGRDCISEIPPQRWSLDGFYDPDRDNPSTSYCKWGGFIAHADCFDARFFGISPLEAETLDPQARKFMEVVWNTLEDAGVSPERMFDGLAEDVRLKRTCGVYVGVMYGDYQLFGPEQAQRGNLIGPNADYWNIANRVSAFLDVHGPSMAIDTACSSSLSAIHLACQALRAGECSLAIAGGVNLCLHPRRHWILSKAGMAASDGRCHSFGAGGDGYVPGEGIGAMLLKPLAQARADGDRIQGIILGSAVNHGGRTSGYTVPNPVAQGDAIRAAIARAQIDPRSISYIEAHGTGTPLGDPIEIRGILRAFENTLPETCSIGSVKANIGHLESAAGIAGLTKVLLQMRHRTLAPTLHADRPNPDLNLNSTPFRVQTEQAPWRSSAGAPLRAGISSFGAGGANVHLIVEASAENIEDHSNLVPREPTTPYTFVLSAKDDAALKRRAGQLAMYLASDHGQQQKLADVAHTLAHGRAVLARRCAVTTADRAVLIQALQDFAKDAQPHPAITLNDAVTPNVVTPPFDPQAHRIALPAYPFAQRRLWVKLTQPTPAAIDTRGSRAFHCDQPPVADHQVAGQFIVPGASSLLLALTLTRSQRLTNLAWRHKAVLKQGEALVLHAERKNDDDRITVTLPDSTILFEAWTALADDSRAPPDDLTDIAAACTESIDSDILYTALADAGVRYGPSLRALAEVQRGDGIAIAHLHAGYSDDAVFDAAFQLTFAVLPDTLAHKTLVPVGAEALALSAPLSSARSVLAQRRDSSAQGITLDLQLLDNNEGIVAWIDGFQARTVAQQAVIPTTTDLPLPLFRPEWAVIVASTGERWHPGRAIVLSQQHDDPVAASLAAYWSVTPEPFATAECRHADTIAIVLGAAAENLTEAAELTQRVLASLLERLWVWVTTDKPPTLLLISREAYPELAINTLTPATLGTNSTAAGMGAAVAAFLRAVAREREDWSAVTIDLPAAAWDAEQLPTTTLIAIEASLAQAQDTVPRERAWRDGLLLERILAPLALAPSSAQPWRNGDVLVIAGSGGLGCLLARHAATHAEVAVALLGRRSNPNTETAATLQTLQNMGRRTLYLPADLTDAPAMRSALAQATAELGPISWIVHTALVMGDASIRELSTENLDAVLAPKTQGLANLVTAAADSSASLRGLLVFSSSNALTANPGQAAYAAASAFIDNATLQLARSSAWSAPVHIFDWGFWGETGAVADAEHQDRMARLGVLPILDQEGLAVLENSLTQNLERAVVLKLEEHLLQPMGVDKGRAIAMRSSVHPPLPQTPVTAAVNAIRSYQGSCQRFPEPTLAALNQFAARRLLLSLKHQGIAINPGSALDADTLNTVLQATPQYRPLLTTFADMLRRADLSDTQNRANSHAATLDASTLAVERSKLETEAPAIIPTLALMDVCLQALGAIVSGQRDASDVLFPNGDAAAVEAIYRGNPVVDHFQQMTATAVAASVEQLWLERQGQAIRILEVGAGTGATSAFVLPALAELDPTTGRHIDYFLTDLGANLASTTAARFEQDFPFLQAGRLDVSQRFDSQGFELGSIDLIIAANVLHATADLSEVLANLKEALAPGGLLVLNEATSNQDVNTVTFGLTPGWWAFRDSVRRLPDGPLLDPGRWSRVLDEAGFVLAACFGLPLEKGGEHPLQSVMIAVADGFGPDRAIRQQAAISLRTERSATDTQSLTLSGNIEEPLRRLISETLRLEPEELGLDDSFADFGADSILSVELVRRINSGFGVDLKSTALFNYATVRELARYLALEHGVGAESDSTSGLQQDTAQQVEQGKQRTQRLLDVIQRRRQAAPVNREAAFWRKETTGLESEPPATPAPLSLDELLMRLESGEISVSEALELEPSDD